MMVINLTKNALLARKFKIASRWQDVFLGLINPKNPRAMLFNIRFGIHTIGLNKPIDVAILDQNYKIIKVKHSLAPFRIFIWHPKFNKCLELPSGILRKTNSQVGDKIIFTKGRTAAKNAKDDQKPTLDQKR